MKKILPFILLTTLVAGISSCGQKNKVNSNQLGTTSTVFSSGIAYNGTTGSSLNAYVSQYNCTSGSRHASALFYLTTAYSYTTIGGTFTQGTLSGTIGTTYVGRSALNDIMVVSKVLNGSGGLMGYNVEVAYCVDNNNQSTPPYFASRSISRFAANGITLVEPTTSPIGFLVSKTRAQVDPYQGSCVINGVNSYACAYPIFLDTSFGY